MEQIRAMLDEMSNDIEFGKEMHDLIKDGETTAIIAGAKKKGFTFTDGDWNEYLRWSESVKNDGGKPVQGAELPPEELENVSGGGQWEGVPWGPLISECWFHAGSEALQINGRPHKRCNQFACKTYVLLDDGLKWVQCGCWGTEKCVQNWHYAEGCPKQ